MFTIEKSITITNNRLYKQKVKCSSYLLKAFLFFHVLGKDIIPGKKIFIVRANNILF